MVCIQFMNKIMFLFTFVVTLPFLPIIYTQKIREDLLNHPNWNQLDRGDNCGHNVADRIIGGTEANLGQYPWLARLGYSYYPDSSTVDYYGCGGVLISSRYVLSAAHCDPELSGSTLLKIRLGEYNSLTEIDCMAGECAPPVQDFDIEEYTCHVGFDGRTLHDDICLIRLAGHIQENDYVHPICLPVYDTFQKESMAGLKMEVAGWGITDIKTQKTSKVLMTLQVPVLPQDLCVKRYSPKKIISNKQLCAGGVVGKDSCMGDSGGPLMRPFSMAAPPRYFVVGVVSFGPRNCGSTTTPGVYTKVADYMTWILDNIKE